MVDVFGAKGVTQPRLALGSAAMIATISATRDWRSDQALDSRPE